MPREGRRRALIVASSTYSDPHFHQLIAPDYDAQDLAQVLSDPQIGDFTTQTLINRPHTAVNREIEIFFKRCDREDLLLLYFSCHGVKDDQGRLYFVTIDTEDGLYLSTAIPDTTVQHIMNNSPARRQILILDCCYSGAYAEGIRKGDESVEIQERFQGKGRVILTASNSVQYALQEAALRGDICHSIFTKLLIEGLRTGEADRNGDGWISTDELYRYIYHQLRDSAQTPCKYSDVEGEIYVAFSPRNHALVADYQAAREAQAAGRLDEALQLFRRIFREQPNYREVSRHITELQGALEATKVAQENQALFESLEGHPMIMSYLQEAKQAGLDRDQLPQVNLGTLLEKIVWQIVAQEVADHATLPPRAVVELLSYLGFAMFNADRTAYTAEEALQIVNEAGVESGAFADPAAFLTWLTTTYWLQRTAAGDVAFRDPYAEQVFAALYLASQDNPSQLLPALSLKESPPRWKEVLALLSGMVAEDLTIELLETLLRERLVLLAGWCIAKGQPLPQSTVGQVVQALISAVETGKEPPT